MTKDAPLRDRILKCLYDAYTNNENTIDAREVATRVGDDTRTVHRQLQQLAQERLVIPSDTFKKTGNVSEHIYLYSIAQTGITAIESKNAKPQPSVKIKAKNYFHNENSTIGKQAGTINETPVPPVEKKQIKFWKWFFIVLGGVGSAVAIYEFVLKNWLQVLD